MSRPGAGTTAVETAVAMVAFAANSLLCRAALAGGAIDATTFTALRLGAGALALVALARARTRGGSWTSAAALASYAFLFSIAYLRIPAGIGALALFGAVQTTMLAAGLARGERPRAREWLGLALALAGLVALARPGREAPDALGVAAMAAAGVAWGVYSLRGRGNADALGVNAANFARAAALVPLLAALALGLPPGAQAFHLTPRGAALALVSGAITSGLGYALWYVALRGLTATRAAIVQLAVPPLAALGGVALLGERPTLRLALCGAAILGGVALALTGRRA
jgi:drug/metabolite transporter (DMT)-like permease